MLGRVSKPRKIWLICAAALWLAAGCLCASAQTTATCDLKSAGKGPDKAFGIVKDQKGKVLPQGTEVTVFAIVKGVPPKKIGPATTVCDDKGHFIVSLSADPLSAAGTYTLNAPGLTTKPWTLPNDKKTGMQPWSFGTVKFTTEKAPAVAKQSETGIPGAANASTGASTTQTPESTVSHPGTIQVTGKVTDDQQHPLPRVTVAVSPKGNPIDQAMTDEDGQYILLLRGKGKYHFTASSPEYGTVSWDRSIEGPENLGTTSLLKNAANGNPPGGNHTVQSYSITLQPEHQFPIPLEQMLWILAAAILLVVITLQVWAMREPSIETQALDAAVRDLQRSIDVLEVTMAKAEDEASREKTRVSRREQEHAAAAAQRSTAERELPSSPAIPVAGEGHGAVPVDQRPEPVQKPAPSTPEDLYDQARNAPDQMAAINDFRRHYSLVRLSLVNEQEVEVNPNVKPEFTVHSQGWFLGIERDGEMLCFPWFSIPIKQQSQTFQKAFTFQRGGSLRVTAAARLSRRGENWILDQPGRIEAAL